MLAVALVMLTVVSMCGGLAYRFSWLWVGVVAGALASIVSTTAVRASAVAAAACATGLLVGPVNLWLTDSSAGARLLDALLAAGVAACFAALLRVPALRTILSGNMLVWGVVAVILGNLWFTTLTLNATPTLGAVSQQVIPAFNEQLNGTLPPGSENSDNVLFFRTFQSVRDGEPYYKSYRDWFVVWGDMTPRTLFNFRMPLLFHLWAAMPRAQHVVWLFLGLVSAVCVTLVALFSRTVKRPFVVPAVAALASYALYFSTSLLLFTMEQWAALPALLGLAFTAASLTSARWRAFVVASVVASVVAVVFRETMGLILVAGLLSAVAATAEQRRFRLLAWGGGVVVLAGIVAVHYWFARPFIDPRSELSQFIGGGAVFALRGLEYATDYLGGGGPWPFILAAVGFIGAAVAPDRPLKVFALVSTIAPLVAFAFLANHATEHFNKEAVNYWGAVVTPLIYASMPFAFLLLPGAKPRDWRKIN